MTNDERAQLEVLRAELNGKLDLLVERTANVAVIQADHEKRVRALEKWRYAIPATLIVSLFSAIAWALGRT